MKYTLPNLIKVIDSKNQNWTEERISWFIDSIKEDGTNYNALTRADRKVISGFSDSKLEAYVGSLLGEPILNNAKSSSEQIRAEAERTRSEADNYLLEVTQNAQTSAQQIKLSAETSMEQLLDNAKSEAERTRSEADIYSQQIRDDASTESKEYLANLKAAEVVELYEGNLPAESTLMRMPKKVLSDYAQLIRCDINNEMTKREIVDTISNNYDSLGKTVIVVPDKSGQLEQINQERMSLELLENASDLRISKLDNRESNLQDWENRITDREQSLEATLNGEEYKEKQAKRLKLAQKMSYVMAGVALAAGAVYGEYTGITDAIDLTHLRG